MDRFADVILAPIALFSGRPLAVVIALSILGCALGLWLGLLLPAERRFIGGLNRLALSLRAIRLVEGSQHQHVIEADRLFADSNLAGAWLRYRSSVEFNEGKAESYADPAAFFSVAYLPGHGYAKWSGTLGGVFLTVGLFFTFVGLSAALLQMGGDGHGSLNPAQLKLAVEGILAVSSVKFITSIAGILAYIFWSLVARQQSATQVHAEEGLLAEIRSLSTYVAPEMLLRRQVILADKQVRLAEMQRDQFSNLAVTLAQSLSDALGKRVDAALGGSLEALPQEIARSVGASVTESFAPIRAEMSLVGARIGEANASVAETAGAAFGSLWQEGVGQHLHGFGEQLANALSTLAQSQTSFAATLASFEEKAGGIPEKLAAATEQSAQDLGSALRKTLDGAATAANEASRASGDMMSARMAEISASLASVASRLTQAGESSHAQMTEGAKLLSQSGEVSATRLSATIETFALAVQRLSSRLDDVERGLDAQNRRLAGAGTIVADASASLSKAAGSMEQAAGAMEQAASPLTAATLHFHGAMDRFSEAAARIRQISSSGDAIAAHIASFGTQMTASLEAFDALPEKIRGAEGSFGGEIGKSAGQLTEAALRMSAAFERGQASLATTLASFEQKIAAIPATLASASEQSTQEIGAKVREALDQAASTAAAASSSSADIMSSRVGDIARSLTQAALELQAASKASGEHMQASHGQLATGVADGVKIITDTAEQSAGRLAQTVESFAVAVFGLSSKLGEVLSGLDAHNVRLETAGALVSSASGKLAQAAAPLTKATVSFQGAMDTFSDAADQMRTLHETGQTVAEQFERTATAAHQALGSHAEAFGKVERSVAETLGQLVGGVQSLGQEISACIETYDNEIAKSIGSLETALIDIGDIVDDRAAKRMAAGAR